MEEITRRTACRALALGAVATAASLVGLSRGGAAHAEESTAQALSDAQAQYDALQAQLDDLASQVENASVELSSTLDSIESKQSEIDDTQAQIDDLQTQLEQYQSQLSEIMASDYKSGSTSALDVILSSSDYEELTRNIYYLTKLNDSETELIQQTWQTQQDLQSTEDTLQQQLSDLQSLKDQQESQLADIQASQDQTYALLTSASEQVQQLTDQYNAELVAQAQAAEEARKAQEAAAAAAAQTSTSSASLGASGYSGESSSGATGSASAVVSACYSTPSPGAGLCAAWVTNVFSNAGMGYYGGNACDMYSAYCYSTDQSALSPGMIIAVSTHNLTTAGSIYGHIGIYVGGGTVMDNIGYIRSISASEWISTYSTTVPARWGWLGGVALS